MLGALDNNIPKVKAITNPIPTEINTYLKCTNIAIRSLFPYISKKIYNTQFCSPQTTLANALVILVSVIIPATVLFLFSIITKSELVSINLSKASFASVSIYATGMLVSITLEINSPQAYHDFVFSLL